MVWLADWLEGWMSLGGGMGYRGEADSFRGVVRPGLTLILSLLLVSCFGTPFAHAAFKQPFACQVRSGLNGVPGNFEPGGVAVDQGGSLWVTEQASRALYQFDPSCHFTGPDPGPAPLQVQGSVSSTLGTTVATSLAIEYLTGEFFLTGPKTTGAYEPFVEVFAHTGVLQPWSGLKFGEPILAIDHSTDAPEDPSACGTSPLVSGECFVYLSHGSPNQIPPTGDGLPNGIEKFTASGAPAAFVDAKGEPSNFAYVSGNEITGTPTESFDSRRPGAIAVDTMGDIYAVNGDVVSEFAPSGQFLQNLTGEHTPGLGGNTENGGFGGPLTGVAVDPVTGIVAVSLRDFVFEEPSKDLGAIDEYNPSTGTFLGQVTETEVEVQPGIREKSHLFNTGALAFGPLGELYVVDEVQHAVDAFAPGRFVPSFRFNDVSGRTRQEARLNDEIGPEMSLDPEAPRPDVGECSFEYASEEVFSVDGFSGATSAPCVPGASELPGDSWTQVHAQISGLVSGTTYEYRLTARISGALGGISNTVPLAFTAPHAPRIYSASSSNRSSSFVDLAAQIDPLGANTSYHFEYVDQADFEASGYARAKATSEADIGAGGASGAVPASVVRQVGGLQPGVIYHFRVVAQNEVEGKVETTTGSDGTFATLPATLHNLPDGRAYELVTPADKGGATDMFASPVTNGAFINKDVGYVSESGQSFLLETNSAFGPLPAAVSDRYVFRREPSKGEWTYTSLASPSLGVQRISTPVFEPRDFATFAFDDFSGSEAGETGSEVISVVGALGGQYSTMFVGHELVSLLNSAIDTIPVGASHDVSHVILESLDHTIATGAKSIDPGSHALYEWNGSGQCGGESLRCPLVSVSPPGTAFKCGARLGRGGPAGTTHNAVSSDGKIVLFTAPDPGVPAKGTAATVGCWDGATTNAPQLYMRREGKTTQISAPAPGVKEGGKAPVQHAAVYVGAAEDDSIVYFLTETELTQEVAQLGLHDMELYAYDTKVGTLTRVSVGVTGTAPARVRTVPAISADGSVVYFTALGELTTGLAPLESDEVNLYRYDLHGGTTTYVATVNQQDYPTSNIGSWITALGLPNDVALETVANWYTSPDGDYLLFSSSREITSGYSTANSDCVLPEKQDTVNGHCYELYRYHYEPRSATGGSIVCVSCDPSGAPPVSNAEFARSAPAGPAATPVRAMSNDGSYVFFDTADPLVAQDGNGTLDVYEWHEGHISLLSSGSDAAPSFFLGASPDGANVYFGTHSELVTQDGDASGDIYDARICTATDPCFTPPPVRTAQCEGDACQNPPPAPIDSGPVSLTFSGAGNFPMVPPAGVKRKTVTQAQKLAKALKACDHRAKHERMACERDARKRFGSKARKTKSVKKAKSTRRGAARRPAQGKGRGR